MEILYAMMQINVHERNNIAAFLRRQKSSKKIYRDVAQYQNVALIARRDWLALLTEEAGNRADQQQSRFDFRLQDRRQLLGALHSKQSSQQSIPNRGISREISLCPGSGASPGSRL